MGLQIAVDGSALSRPWTGMGTYSRELLSELARARRDAELAVYTQLPGGVAELRHQPNIAFGHIPNTRFVGRHLLWAARLNRSRADAYFGINGLLPLGFLAMPAVATVHDLAIYRNARWFPGRQPLSTKAVVPRSLNRADALIAISEHTKRDLQELFSVPAPKITVVHSGVGTEYRPIPEVELVPVREELGLAETFILFVGTIEPRKNVETLVQAWRRLSPRPQLVIAGGYGWRYEATQSLIESQGGEIRVLGPVSPALLPALYNLATCLVHVAWYEGFGLTPLEAMACGTPVVASATTSVPEVVGDAGLLVEPGDVGAIRTAIERVLADPQLADELGRRGLERARGFSWRAAARQTWQVLDDALRR